MEKSTYWEPCNPTELALNLVYGYRGAVSEAEMHLTTAGVDCNIVLLRPRLISDIHHNLAELSGDLAGVKQVQCFRQPQADGTLRCRIEITRQDGEREIIQCNKIKGLPV